MDETASFEGQVAMRAFRHTGGLPRSRDRAERERVLDEARTARRDRLLGRLARSLRPGERRAA